MKVQDLKWLFLLPFSFCLLCYAQDIQQNAPNQEVKQEAAQPAESQDKQPSGAAEESAAKEEIKPETIQQAELNQEEVNPVDVQQIGPKADEQTAVVESLVKSQNVTLDFKEADIRNILKIIAIKTGVNIVATPEVIGNVSIRLVDVPWEKALIAILKTYGFGYDKQENIIIVAPIEKLTTQKKQEAELSQVQPTVTEIFNLKYVDAQDTKKALEAQLSPRGKITVLEVTGQAGWEFGTTELGKRERIEKGRISRSKTLIISDIPPVLERIAEIIQRLDVQPQQILVEAKLIEVNHDKLRDIGFNWGTGVDGSTQMSTYQQAVKTYYWSFDTMGMPTKKSYDDVVTLHTEPLVSKATKVLGAQMIPSASIGEFLFQKLTSTQFEAVLKALETKGDANTLSAPHIMTLNNQEATILIGNKFPLIKSTVSSETGSITGQSLDRYQDIGIQLNVVPQISGKDFINLIVHPVVSTYTQTVKAVSSSGQTMAEYPIIITREAETQVLMKDGETMVIGGLITDRMNRISKGIPFLKDIPILGLLFRMDSTNMLKVDLLIFISTRIVKEGEFTPETISKLEERLEVKPKKKAPEPKK